MALSRRDAARKVALLKKHNLEGVNKPKRTPKHPTKSHIVLAQEGDKIKLIRFGEQGASTAGKPKSGESDKMKKRCAVVRRRRSLAPLQLKTSS
jgi:hypothetical protein